MSPPNFFFRCFRISTASSYRGLEPVISSSWHRGVSSSFRKSHAGPGGRLGEDDLLSAEGIQTVVSRSALAPRNWQTALLGVAMREDQGRPPDEPGRRPALGPVSRPPQSEGGRSFRSLEMRGPAPQSKWRGIRPGGTWLLRARSPATGLQIAGIRRARRRSADRLTGTSGNLVDFDKVD